MKMSDMKDSFPYPTAVYAKDNDIIDEPSFLRWWAYHVLRRNSLRLMLSRIAERIGTELIRMALSFPRLLNKLGRLIDGRIRTIEKGDSDDNDE
jgi:hypothetical protein